MQFLTTHVIPGLLQYKYVFLFPAVVIEGPIITIVAGFLASLGFFNVFVVYGLAVTGDLTGDCIYYAIGRYGRTGLINKWGRYLGITVERVEKLENHFQHHRGKTLITGKIAHGVGAGILLAAGLAKMPFGEFLRFNFLATLPKSLILLLIGFYFGEAYARIYHYLDYVELGTIAVAIILVVIYFITKYRAQRLMK